MPGNATGTRDKAVYSIFEKDSKSTHRNLSRFYQVLMNLRFQGRQNLGKNMAELRRLVSYFEKEVVTHMKEEEQVLFPFLMIHLPKFDAMIRLLAAEHDDFKNGLKDLNLSLAVFRRVNSDKTRVIHQLNQQGIYLVCLLRGHMAAEARILYKAADHELHTAEKEKLLARLKKNAARRRAS